jgi:FkbM family methyltransferase
LIADGSRVRDRLRIARILLYAHLRLGRARFLLGWIPVGDDAPRPLRLRTGVTVLARRRDAVPLHEQFALDCYGVELEARAVLDLGANVGFATVALAARHPGARFACVEPDPETVALLEQNVRLNGVDAVVIGAAVVGAPGRYELAAGRAPASNRVQASDAGAVEGVTVAEVLARAGLESVDLMKVDIEGAEAGVFASAAEWAPRVGAVIAELHPPLGVSEADRLLTPHGFKRVALPQGLRFRDVTLWIK